MSYLFNRMITREDFTVAPHANLQHTPQFWNPEKAYSHYSPDIDAAFMEGVEFRGSAKLKTAKQLIAEGVSNLAMLTDLQNDFREGWRLPVAGTDDVVLRAAVRLLNGTAAGYFTGVVKSYDWHPGWHISYSTSWRTKDGKPLDLREYKAVTLGLADRSKGLFKATAYAMDGSEINLGYVQSSINQSDTVAYWDHLQDTNQGPIWLFAGHCKQGTDGANLHPLLAEVIAFMEGALMITPMSVYKGHLQNTDWFGPLQPCRPDSSHPQGGVQMDVLNLFNTVQRIEFFGVAEDFCDYWMKVQTLNTEFGPDLAHRMAFATDGTAPIVPNAPHVQQLNSDARARGVRFFKHDDPFNS